MAVHIKRRPLTGIPYFAYYVALSGEIVEPKFEEIKQWLADDTRPGSYTVTGSRVSSWRRKSGSASYYDKLEFRFSDEDLAFEFKLRWA